MAEEKKKGLAFFENYKSMLKSIRFKIPAEAWFLISTVVSVAAAIASFSIIAVLQLPVSPLVSLVIFLVALDLMLGYPYLMALRRINAIEEALPDALKQLADTLKAGGTYEYALRELSTSEYGPLSHEMAEVLRKMEEGENLEDSLNSFSRSVDSVLVKRTISIINDAIKAGAGLADVLDEIADDVRAMHRIAKERIAGTMLQVIFIVAAGSVVAPVIMGMVTTVVQLLIETSASIITEKVQIVEAIAARDFIVILMQLYLMVEVIAAGAMIAMTREGRISKSLIYIPMLLLLAFVCYYMAIFVSGLMIGGIGAR
jgi:archaellum biogenesis protein FlaJ (TadC family)